MFLFKKIMANLFSPISLTLELSIIGLLLIYFTSRQKTGKVLIMAGLTILVICSYSPTTNIIIGPLINQYPSYIHKSALNSDQRPQFVVVLGSGYNSVTSLPVASRMGYDSLLRLIEGIRIYRMLPEGKLLLSGGTASGRISSAHDMAQLAREFGVNDEDIIIESESLDTKDQARIIYSMLGDKQFILVTSASHMPRSMALFTKLGMDPVPAPSRSVEEKLLKRQPNPLFPSSINLQRAEMAFHEYLGMLWAKLRRQV